MDDVDAIVVGGGVNGLACALVLARHGLSVRVVEDRPAIGGSFRPDHPFAHAPGLAAHVGSHRLGLLPRDALRLLGVKLPLRTRDPALFVPTMHAGRFLLAGPGNEGLRAAVSGPDARTLEAMHGELDAIAADLAPAWLAAPMPVEDVADRYVRPALRGAFLALVTGSIGAYLDRFAVPSELVRAAIAADALVGTFGTWDTPGSGAALLVQHVSRSPEGGGDAVPDGDPGALVQAIAAAAEKAGATITAGRAVARLLVEGNSVAGVVLEDGSEIRSTTVVCNADPLRLRAMIGDAFLPPDYTRKIDGFVRGGSVTKLAVAFASLPRFACLPEERGQHGATIHLLPGGDAPMAGLRAAFADASAGRLPAAPPIEMIIAPAASGPRAASLLVPCSPYDLEGTTWAAEEERWTKRILDVLEAFAPGASGLVVDAVVQPPKKLEAQLGITRGVLHHVDGSLVFGDRLPYVTPITGLYACGAGCAPAGSAFAVAGHNAAKRVLADLELGLERTEAGQRS